MKFKVVTLGNLLDINKMNPSLVADLIVKPQPGEKKKCCDIDLTPFVEEMMQTKWYKSVQYIENIQSDRGIKKENLKI